MAYERQTWTCGETITADKLNHIEEGLANSGGGTGETLVVSMVENEDESTSLDKTWQEIHDAFPNVVLVDDVGRYAILSVYFDSNIQYDTGDGYIIVNYDNTYGATSPSSYPVMK